MSNLSFYSKEFGGTFHFLQFNVIYHEDFLVSTEFKHFIKFVEYTYPQLKQKECVWKNLVDDLSIKKGVSDMEQSQEITSSFIKKNLR